MDLLSSPISPLQYAILQSYGRLKRINNLEIPVDELEGLQSFLITHLLESRHFNEYPLATSYQRTFWKHIIFVLEASGEVRTAPSCDGGSCHYFGAQDVDERLYRRYMDIIKSKLVRSSHHVKVLHEPPI